MRSVVSGVAAALLAATVCIADESAPRGEPGTPQWMFFAGAEGWHSGAFGHGGLLWSPGGLFAEGFTLKLLAGGGTYRYRAGGPLGVDVMGTAMLGAVMPGWRFKVGKLEVTAVAGLDVQDHRLSLDDPGNRLRGTLFGVRVGVDAWYEPMERMMLAANVSASSVGPSFWARLATGWHAFGMFWLGPEVQGLGGPNYQQFRAGAHITSFRSGLFEWSAGAGFATDSDGRSGAYGRLGVLARY